MAKKSGSCALNANYLVIEKPAEKTKVKSAWCGSDTWFVSGEFKNAESASEFKVQREKFVKKYFLREKRIVKVVSNAEYVQMVQEGTEFYRLYNTLDPSLHRETLTRID